MNFFGGESETWGLSVKKNTFLICDYRFQAVTLSPDDFGNALCAYAFAAAPLHGQGQPHAIQAVMPEQTRQDAADATLEKTKYKEHRN